MFNSDFETSFGSTVVPYVDHIRRTPLRELMPPLHYPSFQPNTPSIFVLRVPEAMQGGPQRSSGRLSDCYKAVFIETQRDRQFVEDSLARPLVVRGNVVLMKETIDKTNLRQSQFPASRDAGFLHYAPAADGWPHLLVVMCSVALPGAGFIRDRYAVSFYETEAEAISALEEMANVIGRVGVPMQLKFGGGRQGTHM